MSWHDDQMNPTLADGIVARVNDSCCDDRVTPEEPFRVLVWIRASRHSDPYWSHVANYPTQREAEDKARDMASGFHAAQFRGTTRFAYPLP